MELVHIPRDAWKLLLPELGFKIRQDGLICTSVQMAMDTKEVLIPIKCTYCGTVLHLRNINVLERSKAVCKGILCNISYASDTDDIEV
jgi:hypothetical protein